MGLTGLEVYDASVGMVEISPDRVNATPFSSVAVLPNMAGDARTPDKLVWLSEFVLCSLLAAGRCVFFGGHSA